MYSFEYKMHRRRKMGHSLDTNPDQLENKINNVNLPKQ